MPGTNEAQNKREKKESEEKGNSDIKKKLGIGKVYLRENYWI